MSASNRRAHDSARLAPVSRTAAASDAQDREHQRLLQAFPDHLTLLATEWRTSPDRALRLLTSIVWDTAATSGYHADQTIIEQAIHALFAKDLAGYERQIFSVPRTSLPTTFVDDGRRDQVAIENDGVVQECWRKLAKNHDEITALPDAQVAIPCAAYAHRLLKLRQRRRDLLLKQGTSAYSRLGQ